MAKEIRCNSFRVCALEAAVFLLLSDAMVEERTVGVLFRRLVWITIARHGKANRRSSYVYVMNTVECEIY